MSDDDLRHWTLTSQPGSNVHQIGTSDMNMRCAVRIAEAAAQMANANRDLVETTKQVLQAHHEIRDKTKHLVYATWGLAVVTVLLVVADFLHK